MYINKNKHILSNALKLTAVVNLGTMVVNATARLLLRNDFSDKPDMLDSAMWNIQSVVAIVQIILISIIFYYAWKKLTHYKSVIPKEDYAEMAKLQEEVLVNDVSTLSSYSISQLLQLWAVILVGAEVVYDITSIAYRDFISQLSWLTTLGDEAFNGIFVGIYNATHGFKYIGMFIAMMLGVLVTGIFLRDRFLKLLVAILTEIYVIAFIVMSGKTLTLFGASVSVVWTSLIFHFLQTLGLFIFAIYVEKKYKGV